MKLIHLSDLHLGKRLNDFSLIEDQKYILKIIINTIDLEKPDAILIAGDVYDKSVPSTEAVELFDDFLTSIAKRDIKCFIISGNHDSAERIAFGGRLMSASGIYLSPVYSGSVEPVYMDDDYGTVAIYMLPFVKPVNVRRFFPQAEIATYDDAVGTAVNAMELNPDNRNVILSHQFVTGALRSDSEEISVGGSDNISADIFDKFDYVALGHIHRPQKVGRDAVRYSGTPLKYSFSEANHTKSLTVVELKEKGTVTISEIPLKPMRDMAELKGSFERIMSPETYEGTTLREDFLHITLTDDEEVIDAIGKLRTIYKNVLRLDYDNKRTRSYSAISSVENAENKSPMDFFAELYELQNNMPMNEEETQFITSLIEKIGEGEVLS